MKNQARNGIDSSIQNNIETQEATLSITIQTSLRDHTLQEMFILRLYEIKLTKRYSQHGIFIKCSIIY